MKGSNRKKPRMAPPTLPELDQIKKSVLNSLTSLQSRRSYQHAMDEFIGWYCSEPRLALNRAVVLRYRLQLEEKKLAASTINVRLAAVRRLASEAADTGLLSPELVAGIRRVKGVPQLGRRVGNWLSAAEGGALLSGTAETLRQKRDAAIIALLLGCGLRRSEIVTLSVGDIQKREEHWAIVDLVGKAGQRANRTRTSLGEDRGRPLDPKRSHQHWDTLPLNPKERISMGQWYHPKRRLVCRQGRRGPGRNRRVGPSRLEENMREIVPRGWRRIGADSIPARTRIRPDHRTIHRMQAKSHPGGKRSASLLRRVLNVQPSGRYPEGDFATANPIDDPSPSGARSR